MAKLSVTAKSLLATAAACADRGPRKAGTVREAPPRVARITPSPTEARVISRSAGRSNPSIYGPLPSCGGMPRSSWASNILSST